MLRYSFQLPIQLQERFRQLYRRYSIPRWFIFVFDNTAVFLTFLFAYLLRFNLIPSDFSFVLALHHAYVALVIYVIFSLIFRTYSGLLRHTTIMDIINVLLATNFSFAVLLGLTLIGRKVGFNAIFEIPLSILIIHYVTINVVLVFVRIAVKSAYQLMTSTLVKKKRVVIFGAGAMGVIVKKLVFSDIRGNYHIVCFVDNNKKLQGKKLNGIPVYSPKKLTPDFIKRNGIEIMIFGIKVISLEEKSDIIRSALGLGLEVFDIPSMDTWLNGQLHMSQIRRVKIEDLLSRESIQLNIKRIGTGLLGKTILVTGAAGSIGSEIVRQLTKFKVKKLILIDQAETPIFNLENELKTYYSQCLRQAIIADITIYDKMEQIFQNYKPDIVFHAAAYKHVPLMEENPHEAIRVNIGGTNVIARLSLLYDVKKFVMISTDKAVNPTNIMGASKRICEMILQIMAQKPENNTQFIITRFGNVLGSNGSVIPIFSKQIEQGGPVTVTHPEITRYFMTIPEACQLVLEAGFMGKGGEIFEFDMGKPVKILDLANQMIRLSGMIPEKDIKIEFTGLRPGEKLYEELLTDREICKPTHHPKIKIALVEKINDLNFLIKTNNILNNLYKLSTKNIYDHCRDLVPEFNSSNQRVSEKTS